MKMAPNIYKPKTCQFLKTYSNTKHLLSNKLKTTQNILGHTKTIRKASNKLKMTSNTLKTPCFYYK